MALPQEKDPIRQNQPQPGSVRGPSSVNKDWQYLAHEQNAGTYTELNQSANDARFKQPDRPTVDETYSQQAFADKVMRPVGIGSNVKKNAKGDTEEDYSKPEKPKLASSFSRTVQRRLAQTGTLNPEKFLFKARASAINISALSWGTPLWLFVQLPFAIIAVLTLAIASGVDAAASGEGGILAWLSSAALGIADTLAKTIGIDFSKIALNLALVSMTFVLIFGLVSLLVLTLIYLMNGIRPLSGDGAGLKMGMFILAIVGYSTPLANILPFVFLYMAAVWFYPR